MTEPDRRHYLDYTGTFNVRHPHSLQLIMDSLRYGITEMHVDGFRFDLAATLALNCTTWTGSRRSPTAYSRTRSSTR